MADAKIKWRFFERPIDTQRPIVDGTVKIEGLEIEEVSMSSTDWDVTDYGSASRAMGVVNDDGLVSIPVFPNRKFRTSNIYVNAKAGIEHPRDLEGKRVATQGWSGPAGLWARGALQNHYEVDLTKIHWFTENPTAVPVPESIRIDAIPQGALDSWLVEGQLDAVINPNILPSLIKRDPRVRRLFPDWKAEALEYWEATHIFPISHIISFRRAFVDQHPEAPVNVLKAYRQARDLAIERIEGGDPEYLIIPWASHQMKEVREKIFGEHYWPYNVEDNKPTLEALTLFCHQQGLTPHRVSYEKIFHPEAAAYPGW